MQNIMLTKKIVHPKIKIHPHVILKLYDLLSYNTKGSAFYLRYTESQCAHCLDPIDFHCFDKTVQKKKIIQIWNGMTVNK